MDRGALLVLGDRGMLSAVHQVLALRALDGERPWVVDNGGSFDPYAVAREARRQRIPPGVVLDRIIVARAFTGYQQLALLRRLAALGGKEKVYLLNPLTVLLDPDLPQSDVPWLFNRLLHGLDWLQAQGMALRLCQLEIHPTLAMGRRFQAALMARYRTLLAKEGRLQVLPDGKERRPVQSRPGPAGAGIRALPARVA